MSNEPLGIYEELQQRRQHYARQSEAVRIRIMGAGPHKFGGPHAETVNPFRMRFKIGAKPFHRRTADQPQPSMRRRTIWHDEASLGLDVVQVAQVCVLASGYSVDEILGTCREHRLAHARHIAMWAIDRYCPDYSLTEIGQMFHRDHTTVHAAIRATEDRLHSPNYPRVKALVGDVRQRLRRIAGH